MIIDARGSVEAASAVDGEGKVELRRYLRTTRGLVDAELPIVAAR
jgi:hypothetical protein